MSFLFISVTNWYSTGAVCAVNNKNQIHRKISDHCQMLKPLLYQCVCKFTSEHLQFLFVLTF